MSNGTAGLFDSYFAFQSSADGLLTISNLGTDYTANGYKVVLFFDIGNSGSNRNYGFRVNGTTYITLDTLPVDSDPTDSGTFTWKKTTSTVSNETSDANYMVFEGLTTNSFTIEGIQPASNRAILSGFQIIANNPVPEPSTYALVVLGGAVWWRCRGKRSAVR